MICGKIKVEPNDAGVFFGLSREDGAMFSVAMGYRLRRFPRESNLDFSCGMLNTALPRSFYEEGDKPLLSLENRSNSVTNDNAVPLFKGREGT